MDGSDIAHIIARMLHDQLFYMKWPLNTFVRMALSPDFQSTNAVPLRDFYIPGDSRWLHVTITVEESEGAELGGMHLCQRWCG